MSEYQVPSSMAEQSILGAILITDRCLPEIQRELRPEDFRLEVNRKVLFQQSQETANKMRGILLKLRNRPDGTAAQGAEKAMKALAEAIGRCAE